MLKQNINFTIQTNTKVVLRACYILGGFNYSVTNAVVT
jgi:hypothetical protein